VTRPRRSLRTALTVACLLAAAGCDATTGSSDNAKVRDAIEGAGIDPSSELRYEHFLYFAEENGARAAAAELALDFEVDGWGTALR
jgi:Regulator of ribonuclease activity B